jgi:hypothetical protein
VWTASVLPLRTWTTTTSTPEEGAMAAALDALRQRLDAEEAE